MEKYLKKYNTYINKIHKGGNTGDVIYDDTVYMPQVGDVVYNDKKALFVVYSGNPLQATIQATNGTESIRSKIRQEYPPEDALSKEERLQKLEDYFDMQSIVGTDLVPEDYFLLQIESFMIQDVDKTHHSPAFKQALLSFQHRLERQLQRVFGNDYGNGYGRRVKEPITTSTGRRITLASEARRQREKEEAEARARREIEKRERDKVKRMEEEEAEYRVRTAQQLNAISSAIGRRIRMFNDIYQESDMKNTIVGVCHPNIDAFLKVGFTLHWSFQTESPFDEKVVTFAKMTIPDNWKIEKRSDESYELHDDTMTRGRGFIRIQHIPYGWDEDERDLVTIKLFSEET